MKQLLIRSLCALALPFLAAAPLAAQTSAVYKAQPGSSLRIDGTSSLHDWTVEGKIIGGSFEVDTAFIKDPTVKDIKVKPKVAVEVFVRTLKSGKAPMDTVMYDALKQAQHPKILYVLAEMTLKTPPAKPGGPAIFEAQGSLTVGGVRRVVKMPVTMEITEADKLKFSGEAKLKMTDFGIDPPAPKMALGLITTGDDIKVTFQWLTALSKEAAK